LYPFLNIFGVQLSVYFIFLSFVFSLIVPLIVRRADKLGLSAYSALDLYLVVLLGAFLGARSFYVFYQEPVFFFENPEHIFYFWNGGYVFFGGFLGSVGLGYLYCKLKNLRPEEWFNFAVPLLSLGYALGRGACFLSGCCYGKETNMWWAVTMHGTTRHPTQVYAVLMELLIFLILIFVESKKGFKAFLVLPIWLILHGCARITMEAYRADPRGSEIIGLSVSTFVSLLLIAVGVFLMGNKIRVR